ncbi:MAG: hypothetical protein EBU90_22540 [Proteobacteria bacterium]|nr:hypothetical protein [Pseudomonadota bacterium]
MPKQKGGKLKAKEVKDFLGASYDKNPPSELDGYILDKELSSDTAKVYYNPETKQAVVVHRGTQGIADWGNNLAYAVGAYNLTSRYKKGKSVQDKAEKKYGKKNISTLGHSQGAILARKLGSDTKEVINVNPAYSGEKPAKNEYNIRSSTDVVSGLYAPVAKARATLTPSHSKKHDITIPSESTTDVLGEHSYNILDRLGEKEVGVGAGQTFSNVAHAAHDIYSLAAMPNYPERAFSATTQNEIDNIYRHLRRDLREREIDNSDVTAQLMRRGIHNAILRSNLEANRQGEARLLPRDLEWEIRDELPRYSTTPVTKFNPPQQQRPRGAGNKISNNNIKMKGGRKNKLGFSLEEIDWIGGAQGTPYVNKGKTPIGVIGGMNRREEEGETDVESDAEMGDLNERADELVDLTNQAIDQFEANHNREQPLPADTNEDWRTRPDWDQWDDLVQRFNDELNRFDQASTENNIGEMRNALRDVSFLSGRIRGFSNRVHGRRRGGVRQPEGDQDIDEGILMNPEMYISHLVNEIRDADAHFRTVGHEIPPEEVDLRVFHQLVVNIQNDINNYRIAQQNGNQNEIDRTFRVLHQTGGEFFRFLDEADQAYLRATERFFNRQGRGRSGGIRSDEEIVSSDSGNSSPEQSSEESSEEDYDDSEERQSSELNSEEEREQQRYEEEEAEKERIKQDNARIQIDDENLKRRFKGVVVRRGRLTRSEFTPIVLAMERYFVAFRNYNAINTPENYAVLIHRLNQAQELVSEAITLVNSRIERGESRPTPTFEDDVTRVAEMKIKEFIKYLTEQQGRVIEDRVYTTEGLNNIELLLRHYRDAPTRENRKQLLDFIKDFQQRLLRLVQFYRRKKDHSKHAAGRSGGKMKNPFKKIEKGFNKAIGDPLNKALDKATVGLAEGSQYINPMAYALENKSTRDAMIESGNVTHDYLLPAVVSAGKPIYDATAITGSTMLTGNPVLGKVAADTLWNEMVGKTGSDPRQNQKSAELGELSETFGKAAAKPYQVALSGGSIEDLPADAFRHVIRNLDYNSLANLINYLSILINRTPNRTDVHLRELRNLALIELNHRTPPRRPRNREPSPPGKRRRGGGAGASTPAFQVLVEDEIIREYQRLRDELTIATSKNQREDILQQMNELLALIQQYSPSEGSVSDSSESSSSSGAGIKKIDFGKVKWGTFTRMFHEFKKENPRARVKDLEAFAHRIIKNKKKFSDKAFKKAQFYLNIIK